MTTGYCHLTGPRGGQAFTLATEVQDAWTEMLDEVSGLKLFEVMEGKNVNSYGGSYSSGAGFVRVRNRQTNVIKMLEPLLIVTEEQTILLPPFTVGKDDVLEEIWVTPPT